MAVADIALAMAMDMDIGPHVTIMYDWMGEAEDERMRFPELLETSLLNGRRCLTNPSEYSLVDNASADFDIEIAYHELYHARKDIRCKFYIIEIADLQLCDLDFPFITSALTGFNGFSPLGGPILNMIVRYSRFEVDVPRWSPWSMLSVVNGSDWLEEFAVAMAENWREEDNATKRRYSVSSSSDGDPTDISDGDQGSFDSDQDSSNGEQNKSEEDPNDRDEDESVKNPSDVDRDESEQDLNDCKLWFE